jgi:hypothetical protein
MDYPAGCLIGLGTVRSAAHGQAPARVGHSAATMQSPTNHQPLGFDAAETLRKRLRDSA